MPKVDWRLPVAAFGIGVLVPTSVAFVRWIGIGLANAPFFAQQPVNPIDPSDDPTLMLTAVIMTAAVMVLIASVIVAAIHKSGVATPAILLFPSIGLMALNWYVLID